MTPVHSLRTKILTIVLAFITLIGTAFVLYSLRTTINYKELRLKNIEMIIEYEKEKINKTIAEIERGAIVYALSGKLCFESQSEELGKKLAVEFLRDIPAAIGGGFWFEPYIFKNQYRAGFYAFYDMAAEKVRLDDSFFIEEYDYHNMSWYREIIDYLKEPYQVVWTMPYTDDTGSYSLMTTAGSAALNENGGILAISTVDWEIQNVVNSITDINPTKNSFVLLCVPEKDYIISSTRTNSIPGASISTIPWDINADSFLLDGIKYLRFARSMDNGWLLSIQIPENEIFIEVEKYNSYYSILITLSLFLMLLLAYILISKLINRPIKKLTSDVAQLALGNLDMQIIISSKDELGQLAQVFNKMTRELKESIEKYTKEHAEKERISTELSVAREIQASMLPCIFPPFPTRKEFDIYASMLPAREVGGDFYDFYFLDKDNLAVVIADVSGKGIPAALFMVITKTLIKNCSSCKNPRAVFESVNKKLCEGNETGMFVTAFMGIYNIPTGRFIYVNAGHNPPLVKKESGFHFLKNEPCMLLAWNKDAKYRENEIILEKKDILYLYTDGVTEAMNKDHKLFGEDRLIAAANKYKELRPKELLHAIKREVDIFADGAEQIDDITMLSLLINNDQSDVNEKSTESKELTVKANKDNLDKIKDFINEELKQNGYSPGLINEIILAVEEIFINIASYAYCGTEAETEDCQAAGIVSVSISAVDKTIIRFEDNGHSFNPIEQPSPNLNTPITEREIGGLGIFIVKKIMDNIEYFRKDNKNILIMTKNR
jgi:sigma-B regulation protein RsbU (phosphoserine phosphatase)